MSPLRRSPPDPGRPTLRQRMAALKASVTRPKVQPAAPTPGPRPLPEPGSEQAKAAFHAACSETDRLTLSARDCYPDLERPDGMCWSARSLGVAFAHGEIQPGEYARLYRQAAEREHRMDAAAIATDLGALWALAFPEECGRDSEIAEKENEDADAELIRLGRQFEVARAREIAACEVANAAQDEAERHEPPRPACLAFRESDHGLSVYGWVTQTVHFPTQMPPDASSTASASGPTRSGPASPPRWAADRCRTMDGIGTGSSGR